MRLEQLKKPSSIPPVLTSDDVARAYHAVVRPNYGKAFAEKRMKSVFNWHRGGVGLMSSMSPICSNELNKIAESKASTAHPRTVKTQIWIAEPGRNGPKSTDGNRRITPRSRPDLSSLSA
jgi:hypothetical protein